MQHLGFLDAKKRSHAFSINFWRCLSAVGLTPQCHTQFQAISACEKGSQWELALGLSARAQQQAVSLDVTWKEAAIKCSIVFAQRGAWVPPARQLQVITFNAKIAACRSTWRTTQRLLSELCLQLLQLASGPHFRQVYTHPFYLATKHCQASKSTFVATAWAMSDWGRNNLQFSNLRTGSLAQRSYLFERDGEFRPLASRKLSQFKPLALQAVERKVLVSNLVKGWLLWGCHHLQFHSSNHANQWTQVARRVLAVWPCTKLRFSIAIVGRKLIDGR